MAAQHNTTVIESVTLTNTLDAYNAGDVIGGLITIPARPGVLRNIKLVDDDNEGAALTLTLFDAQPTTVADDAVLDSNLVVADLSKILRRLTLATADYLTINSNKVGWFANASGGIDHAIDYATVNNNIYAYLTCDATPTLAALSYTLYFTFWQNVSTPAA